MKSKDKIRAFFWVLYAVLLICAVVALVASSASAAALYAPMEVVMSEGGDALPQGIPCDEVDKPTMVYLGRYYITGYDTCKSCCGKTDKITASGEIAAVGRTIATGKEFAFGMRLYIDGIGERTVEDRGVKNGCIDVLCENHADCYAVTGWYDVYLIEED